MNNLVEENINGLKAFHTLGEFLKEDGWYPQQLAGRSLSGARRSAQGRWLYRPGLFQSDGPADLARCHVHVLRRYGVAIGPPLARGRTQTR